MIVFNLEPAFQSSFSTAIAEIWVSIVIGFEHENIGTVYWGIKVIPCLFWRKIFQVFNAYQATVEEGFW